MARPKPPICPVNPKHGPMRVSYFCAQCKAEWGGKGGKRRAKALSSKERREIAQKASKAAVRKRQRKASE